MKTEKQKYTKSQEQQRGKLKNYRELHKRQKRQTCGYYEQSLLLANHTSFFFCSTDRCYFFSFLSSLIRFLCWSVAKFPFGHSAVHTILIYRFLFCIVSCIRQIIMSIRRTQNIKSKLINCPIRNIVQPCKKKKIINKFVRVELIFIYFHVFNSFILCFANNSDNKI